MKPASMHIFMSKTGAIFTGSRVSLSKSTPKLPACLSLLKVSASITIIRLNVSADSCPSLSKNDTVLEMLRVCPFMNTEKGA